MKKIVFFLMLVPLLSFGQNDNNNPQYNDYKFAISVDKLFSLKNHTSFPFNQAQVDENIALKAFGVRVSKKCVLFKIPSTLSLGVNQISSSGLHRSEVIYIDSPSGTDLSGYDITGDLISFPITLSHSFLTKNLSKSSLFIYYGLIYRQGKYTIAGPVWSDISDNIIEDEGYRGFLDGVYGINYDYKITNNLSLSLACESQSNQFTSEGVDYLFLSSNNSTVASQIASRPILLIVSLKYFIR